jgi:hypothetical protein
MDHAKQGHTGLGGSQAHAPRRRPQWPPLVLCSIPPFMVHAIGDYQEYRIANNKPLPNLT